MLRSAALFLLLLSVLRAADLAALRKDAAAAEARFDAKAALALYQQADAAKPNDAFILQKIARQYSDLDLAATDKAERRRLCQLSLDFSRRAVALDPKSAVNVLSLAISYGKLGAVSDTRTEIEYSRLVKRHAEEALALDPGYDYAYHVLGRWHYEVASLSDATRLLVKLIYGALPPASTKEAVRLLRRAAELSPDLPSHHVELGLALLADGQRDAGREILVRAIAMPRREAHDAEAQDRARAALAQLR